MNKTHEVLLINFTGGKWVDTIEPMIGTEEEIRARCLALVGERGMFGSITAAVPVLCALQFTEVYTDAEQVLRERLKASIANEAQRSFNRGE